MILLETCYVNVAGIDRFGYDPNLYCTDRCGL